MTIIGISGSPILNGNTDRLIKAILEQSGKDYMFVNLSTLKYEPCRACAHLCATTNMCPLNDDLKPYLKPILDSEALVLGTPVHAGSITGGCLSVKENNYRVFYDGKLAIILKFKVLYDI